MYPIQKPYEKHGMKGTAIYVCWQDMKSRCLNPNHKQYKDYGGRGITIHEDFITSFSKWYEELGPRPSDKHTIERIDNDGGYTYGNIKWATRKEQACNRRPKSKTLQLTAV